MKTIATNSAQSAAYADSQTASVNLAFVFDCPEHLATAQNVFQRLIPHIGDNAIVHADEWPMSDLGNARFRQEAVELARHCNIFAVVTENLSEVLVEFISDWLNSPREHPAALVLFSIGTQCVREFEFRGLRQLARERQVDYFSTVVEQDAATPSIKDFFSIDAGAELSPLND